MKPFLRFILPAVLLLVFSGCVGSRSIQPVGPAAGRVLEAGSQAPIAGAIVIGRWKETWSSVADSQTVCVHVESTTSDAEGRFVLPEWRGRVPTIIDSFKPGYVRSAEYYKTQSYKQGVDLLEPFKGTREERLKELERFSGMQCGQAVDYAPKLAPLYRAIYAEAKALATTIEEKKRAINLLRELDEMELGYEKSWENWRKRMKELQ